MYDVSCYTYTVLDIEVKSGRLLHVKLDLGFGIAQEQDFLLLGVSDNENSLIANVIHHDLKHSKGVILRSVKRNDQYFADVSYLFHQTWYNLSKEVLTDRHQQEVALDASQ